MRALLRPVSLLVLAAPVLLWAAVLYRSGGATYVFEAFVNNTLGRAVNVRFDVAGVAQLPYGDVNSPQVWWYYPARLGSLAGAAVLLLPCVVSALFRRGPAERGPRTRVSALALCFAVVPLVVLSFSSQKGVHHLGSCTSGFVLAGALWLDRRTRRLDRRELPAGLRRAATAVLLLAPLALVSTLLGQPATPGAASAAAVAAGVAGLVVAIAVLRCGSRAAAVHVFLAGAMAVMVVRGSLGFTDEDDLRFLEFPTWLAREVGSRPVALFAAGDGDLGVFCWALGRDVVPLSQPEDARTFFDSPQSRLCVARDELTGQLLEDQPGWVVFATGGNGVRSYSVLANAAAAAELPAPSVPPPFARQR